jgi:hypothetical protein
MRKECRHCRTVNNAEAPYCDACGCDFEREVLSHRASWSGRAIAIGSGLVAAIILQLLRAHV